MLVNLLFLLWSLTHYNVIGFHRCIPNGQFYINGLLCQCNSDGTWAEANCRPTYKRRICSPGYVMFKDCSRCVCQTNGQYLCSYVGCDEQIKNINSPNARKTETNVLVDVIGTNCAPFKSYYVNCNICFCPPSGKAAEAQCSRDDTCTTTPVVPSLKTLMKTSCVPKLIYSYPCLQCPCSDQGRFDNTKCIDTCSEKKPLPSVLLQCTPKSFYKISCNVCFCPTNGIPDPKYCSKKKCAEDSSSNIKALRQDDQPTTTPECTPYKFTEKRCFYCTCNPGAIVNENHCLEVECDLIEANEYTAVCTPDEMYPICAECYCYQANLMDIAYCTKRCTQENKAAIFKKVLNDSTSKSELLNTSDLQEIENRTQCEPNALYKDINETCLCPETGMVNKTYCSLAGSVNKLPKEKKLLNKDVYKVNIPFNASCSPSKFAHFECNICFCSKNGTIDPKWCTYDDCDTLQRIKDSRESPKQDKTGVETCTPGIVSRTGCNLCLCPQSGLAKHRICSNNPCVSTTDVTNLKLDILCKPTTYYKVDCNVCLCPKDGVKNLESCSKNNCERPALRTFACKPGKLFSDECNICICPLSGSMTDRICTNYTCSFGVNADRNVLASSQQLLDQFEAYANSSRTLDSCYPEEEFVQGCKLCVCPDMGLKQYATCTTMLCDPSQNDSEIVGKDRVTWQRCSSYNVDITTKDHCVPGGIYADNCRQCLCPENGTTARFCRDMPKEYNCSNILHIKGSANGLIRQDETDLQNVYIKHEHTLLPCVKPGKVIEKCQICDCESHEYSYVMIEEHCFKSDDVACANVTIKAHKGVTDKDHDLVV